MPATMTEADAAKLEDLISRLERIAGSIRQQADDLDRRVSVLEEKKAKGEQ